VITYEWTAEKIDAYGDIIDTFHGDTYAEALEWAEEQDGPVDIGLVRDVGDDINGLTDRQWAYLDESWLKLPATFNQGAKMPLRFFREITSQRKG
jgi:hypothetical protein